MEALPGTATDSVGAGTGLAPTLPGESPDRNRCRLNRGECHVHPLSPSRLGCVRATRAAWPCRVRARHSDDGCRGRGEVSQGRISRGIVANTLGFRIVTNTLGLRVVVAGVALLGARVLRHPVQFAVTKSDQLGRPQRQEPQLPHAEPFQLDWVEFQLHSVQFGLGQIEGAQREPVQPQRAPVERVDE